MVGHAEKSNVERLTRRVREKTIFGNVNRGRPPKTQEVAVKKDIKRRNLTLENVQNRDK